MGKSTGQLEPQQWDQVGLPAQGKVPLPGCFLAISIHFFCGCILVSPLTPPTLPPPHGPLQASATPALSSESVGQSWSELIGGGFFAGFLSPQLSCFFPPLVSLFHPSKNALLQLHLPCRSPSQGTTLFRLYLAAWSLRPPTQMLATIFVLGALSPLHHPSSLLHISDLRVTCSGQWETLISITPCYLSKQTPSCFPWSCRTMPCAPWHHRLAALQCCHEVLLCHSDLCTLIMPLTVINSLSLSSPELYSTFIFCFLLDLGCNLLRASTISFLFFLGADEVCNTRELVQGQSS